MKISQNFSLLFFLSKKRADRNGLCPIYLRLTIDGKRSPDLSLGHKVHPKHWDNNQKKVVGLSPSEAKPINLKILQVRTEYESKFSVLESEYGKVSVEQLINAVRPACPVITDVQPTIYPVADLHKRIDKIFIQCRTLDDKERAIAKIKDGLLKAEGEKQLPLEKKSIVNEIEKLIALTLEVYATMPNEERTIIDAAYEFSINFLRKAIAGTREFSTCKKWWVTKGKLADFVAYTYKNPSYRLFEVTRIFGERFYDYLRVVNRCGHNCSMKIIKNTRQIFQRAVEGGWLSANPLASFKCSYIDPDREGLTIEELIELVNADLGEKLNIVRDAFLFCCFTGFAYEDAKKLTTADIFTGIDGKQWVKTGRIKTDVRESVPLLPIALLILEKYSGHPCRIIEHKLVPIYSNQYYNRCLKVIAKECNIQQDLTTHYARHTFATTVTLENDVPLVTVAKMLGVKSVRTAEKYAKTTQRKISRNMNRLQTELFDEKGHLKPVV